MKTPKIYFYHGFAGDAQDWKEVIAQLPGFSCQALTYPFELPNEGILVGYSMGGRIASQSGRAKFIISAHPGLSIIDEKEERLKKEAYWLHQLKTIDLLDFFQEWYQQPIFESLRKHPKFESILERRIQQNRETLIDQMEKHSLALYNPQHRNTIFLYGEYDTSYQQIYRSKEIPAHVIPQAGHACHLENPAAVADKIKLLINSLK